MAASGSGTSGTASDEGRTAEHIAWEQSVKDAAANGGHKPDERGEYRCRYPGCSRVFSLPGALHTHTGWHKRKENISAGVYDRLGHHLKEIHSMADAQGRVTVLEVYRCDFPGCAKLFQSRGALHTHQGWHKRRPKEGQTFMVQQAHKRSGQGNLVETPRKRTRRDDVSNKASLPARSSSIDESKTSPARNKKRANPPALTAKIETQADNDAAAALGLLANIAQADSGVGVSTKIASGAGINDMGGMTSIGTLGGFGAVGVSGVGGVSGGVRTGIGGSSGRMTSTPIGSSQQSPAQFAQMTQQPAQMAQTQQNAFWATQGMPQMMQQMQAQLAAQQQNLQRVAGLASQMTAFSGGSAAAAAAAAAAGAGYANLPSAAQLQPSLPPRDRTTYDYSKEQHNAV